VTCALTSAFTRAYQSIPHKSEHLSSRLERPRHRACWAALPEPSLTAEQLQQSTPPRSSLGLRRSQIAFLEVRHVVSLNFARAECEPQLLALEFEYTRDGASYQSFDCETSV
jgi:hypothetical protein